MDGHRSKSNAGSRTGWRKSRLDLLRPGPVIRHWTTFKALGAVARLFIWIALGLAALSALHIQIRPLLTGLGIGGLAIALAIQNILGDLFAAISIVVDKPFVVGDSISVENYRGKVEHIGLKTTRLRSESGEQIIFSNGELLKSKIRNYSR